MTPEQERALLDAAQAVDDRLGDSMALATLRWMVAAHDSRPGTPTDD